MNLNDMKNLIILKNCHVQLAIGGWICYNSGIKNCRDC